MPSGFAMCVSNALRTAIKSTPPWTDKSFSAEKAIVEYCLDGKKFFPEHVTKDENIQLKPGDTARIGTPGGGGWGNPFSRDPLRVLRDVQLEFVTIEAARKRYLVAIEKTDNDYNLNIEETNNLRETINFS